VTPAPPKRSGTAPALAVLCAALGSILPGWARVPIPLYDPAGRAWRLARIGAPGGPRVEMAYYGTYLVALIGFIVGALIGRAIENRVARSALLDAWAFTALAIALGYQIWMLWT
jgi:hypothetical protein